MGNRRGVLAREMTKRHEEFLRGRLSEIRGRLLEYPEIKGECTLLIAGYEVNEARSWDEVRHDIRTALKSDEHKITELARNLAKKHGIPKNRIYDEALKVRRDKAEDR